MGYRKYTLAKLTPQKNNTAQQHRNQREGQIEQMPVIAPNTDGTTHLLPTGGGFDSGYLIELLRSDALTAGDADPELEELRAFAMESPSQFAVALGYDVFPQQFTTEWAVMEHERVAIRGCHSSGKTFFMSILAVWWVLKYEDALVLTTAPTLEQVTKVMWGYIRTVARRAREKLKLTGRAPDKTQWMLDDGRSIQGRSTARAVNFQGYHSPNCLIIIDEAPGLIEDLWGAIDGITASGNIRIVMLGNPTISSGMFFEASRYREGWTAIRYSALRDNPNVTELPLSEWKESENPIGMDETERGRLATLLAFDKNDPELDNDETIHMAKRRWIRERWMDWGRREDPQWHSRVLGEFPPEDEHSLIARSALDRAGAPAKLEIEAADAIEWGVDVAGSGQNDTVVVARQGEDLLGLWALPDKDSRAAVKHVIQPWLNQTAVVRVDFAGMGEYFTNDMADWLSRIDLPIQLIGVNVGRGSSDSSRYMNLRMELSWRLKQRFDEGKIRGVRDEKLRRELLSLRWFVTERGVRQMEPKKEMEERGVPSPDRADALTLAFAGLDMQDVQANATIVYEPDDFSIGEF